MILLSLQQSVILLLALCAVRLMRRQPAAMRHFVLAVGLVSSFLVPLLQDVFSEFDFVQARPLPVFTQNPIDILLSVHGTEAPASPELTAAPAPAPTALFRWVWYGGMGVAAGLLIAGALRIKWLAVRSKPLVMTGWVAALKEVSTGLGLSRSIRLLQNEGTVLGTWGALRPRVFLPHDAHQWPAERVRVVLTHELAHIKRLDWPVQMLAEVARAVYWFNPLFWAVCRRLKLESEHACDDVVLRAGFDAKHYATHLLELARAHKQSTRLWTPVLAMSRPKNLERRFVAMLNPSVNRRSLSWATVFGTCVVAACLTVPLAAMRAPQQFPPTASPGTNAAGAVGAAQARQRAASSNDRANEKASVATTPVQQVAVAAPKPASKPATSKPAPPPLPVQGRADGSLSGTVSDASGAVVPGVRVTVMTSNQRSILEKNGDNVTMKVVEPPQAMETTSGEVGQYEFRALTPGEYIVTASLPGFANVIDRVQVMPSQTSRHNVTLLVGGLAQRVTVSVDGQPRPRPDGYRQRVRVGGNIQAANLISQVKPVYPENVREAGIEGVIRLQGVIGVDGAIVGLRVVASNNTDLAAAAVESVRQWRYRPAMLNGVPIEVVTDIAVEFELAR